MVEPNDLLKIVTDYLAHDNADKFVLEFSAASYNIHKNGSPDAIALVNTVESKIAEVHGGCISRDSFKKYLFEMLAESKPSQQIVVVYSGSGMAPAENASNSQQTIKLRPVPPQPMLPTLVRLVGQH
jgi:hypothetical protein